MRYLILAVLSAVSFQAFAVTNCPLEDHFITTYVVLSTRVNRNLILDEDKQVVTVYDQLGGKLEDDAHIVAKAPMKSGNADGIDYTLSNGNHLQIIKNLGDRFAGIAIVKRNDGTQEFSNGYCFAQ